MNIDSSPSQSLHQLSYDLSIDPVWGTAYNFFGGGENGKKACQAIGALAGIGQVDTTISNFLVPLQVLTNYIISFLLLLI